MLTQVTHSSILNNAGTLAKAIIWPHQENVTNGPPPRHQQNQSPNPSGERCVSPKNKQSSFAWLIMHDTTTLWKGVGLAPGTADDIHSGQAVAFGLLAGLLFLQHYIKSYDPSQFTDSP